jgi:hypothetical protein
MAEEHEEDPDSGSAGNKYGNGKWQHGVSQKQKVYHKKQKIKFLGKSI